MLHDNADAFIASAYEWEIVKRVVAAVPGSHAGFDPLAFYARSFALNAAAFINGAAVVADRGLMSRTGMPV